MMKFEVPATVEVPEIVVVLLVELVASVRPVGRVPEETDQV
jgi:hypothetical protein